MARTVPQAGSGPLMAYVGTFSSPAEGRAADAGGPAAGQRPGDSSLSASIRATGALTPAGVHEMGTSPSCLAINAAGTGLYSANETDRVGDDKEGTVSAFAIDRADGTLRLLNTVRSGGAGPTYVSVHPGRAVPAGRELLRRFGGRAADRRRRPARRRLAM